MSFIKLPEAYVANDYKLHEKKLHPIGLKYRTCWYKHMMSPWRYGAGCQHKTLAGQALLNVTILKLSCSILQYLANHIIGNKLFLLISFKIMEAKALERYSS